MAKMEKGTMPSKGKPAKIDATGDASKKGYHKTPFGADNMENHFIHDAYVKQANPSESEDSNIHEIAHHQQNSQFYSGDRHVSKSPAAKSTGPKKSGGNENG